MSSPARIGRSDHQIRFGSSNPANRLRLSGVARRKEARRWTPRICSRSSLGLGPGSKSPIGPSRRSRSPSRRSFLWICSHGPRRGILRGRLAQPSAPIPIVEVLDVQPADRHLLLLVREGGLRSHKFLCGHDERHWFVAAVPESEPGGHRAAGEGGAQARRGPVRPGQQGARGRCRQPSQERRLPPPGGVVLPARVRLYGERGAGAPQRAASKGHGGKPHWTEFCYRTGGETATSAPGTPTGSRPPARKDPRHQP